jgi:uncharacterized membrane protein YqjE
MSAPPPDFNWSQSLQRIGESLVGLLRGRFELFAVEWQEEKFRLLNLLFWCGFAVTMGAAGLLIGMAVLALWLWEVAGYAGLIGLSVVSLAIAGGLVWKIRQKILSGDPPFAQTAAEFRKDAECLPKKK